ncbi:ifn-alpha/beta receptor glycoprotein [Volepox virus]|uniref:Ifn-alpha/beta receptor glycoprotein n=1 Tax=Volepox virus TaxID=28874 RepID=A0A1C9KCJ4_9POXV|nr:ifn-alpha/beta receptor glycoprotein [Volepox virus]AOP31885.1 ifn-alpha/beta receptor glycoprotein [Volepox virus]
MTLSIYLISLMILYSCAINIDDSINEFFEKERDSLLVKDSRLLNPACAFGGSSNKMAAISEPFLTACPPVEDSLLSHRYANYVVTWTRGKNKRLVSNRHIKNNNLWIANYTSRISHATFVCTLITKTGDCVQGIVKSHIRKPSCIPETYELGSYDEYGIQLYCGILYANNYRKIKWYKDNKELYIDGTKYTQSDPRLIIHNPDLEDSGRYDCYVYYDTTKTYDITTTRCKVLTVTSAKDHDFTLILDPYINVTIGQSTNITCVGISNSDESYILMEWEDSSGSIIGLDYDLYSVVDSKDKFVYASLYLENITEEYIGNTYTCHGFNSYNEKTLTTTLVSA